MLVLPTWIGRFLELILTTSLRAEWAVFFSVIIINFLSMLLSAWKRILTTAKYQALPIVQTTFMIVVPKSLGSARLRARVGYAIGRFLPYVAVGVAYSRGELFANLRATGTEVENTVNTYWGWTPSVGLEFAITKNLLARAEYAYYDFASNNVTTSGDFVENIDNKIKFQGFKLGLAWEFGGAKEAATEPPPPVQEMKKAPEAVPTVEQKIIEKGRATINVEFDTGKAIVKPAYYKEIEGVADVLKKYPDLKIVVEGHTDNVGGEKYNLNLSQKRAEAVKAVMVNNFKIASDRITAKGFGFSNPLADNSTKEGRQQNRRVEAAVEYTVKK